MLNSSVTISFWLPIQAILLVLGYIIWPDKMPWWITWFPSLIIVGIVAIIGIIFAIVCLLDR
jgi:hypothetical protein